MIYALHDLLLKMGAPELREKNRIEWFYFNPQTKELGGQAEIRFLDGGEILVAEIREADKAEPSFSLVAERTARPAHYRIACLHFDGETYERPSKAIVELGVSLFHARALDISIRMIEQSFNKEDMLDKKEPQRPIRAPAGFQANFFAKKPRARKQAAGNNTAPAPAPTAAAPAESFGVVVPFRPRQTPAAART